MKKLIELDVSENRLERLPAEIGGLNGPYGLPSLSESTRAPP